MVIVIPIVTGLVRFYSNSNKMTYMTQKVVSQAIANIGIRETLYHLIAKSWNIALSATRTKHPLNLQAEFGVEHYFSVPAQTRPLKHAL
jgi:hypothetical protein